MPTTPSVPKRRRRVLAIDDEPAMTEWLKMVIEADGYEAFIPATVGSES